MKIICSSNMPYAAEAFGTLGDVVVLDGRSIAAADVRDADILAIRSTTKVDRELLADSRVRFVGTATIGTDHLDIDYFEEVGIRWCYSPGCNANSVGEYFTAALLCLADRHGFELRGKTVGVIGVGNVGSRVVEKAGALDMRVLPNDPPRQRLEECDSPSAAPLDPRPSTLGPLPFVSLDQLLAGSDIVTLHVPLAREGPDRTFHMADDSFFARMKPGCVFLNCARGAVVETDALLRAADRGVARHVVIDTWEGEPAYRQDLLDRADIGTPHIAGHSFEGKVMGTVMVYREACRFLGVEPAWTPDDLLPAPPVPMVEIDARERTDESALWEIVRSVYDIEGDDRRLRDSCAADPANRAWSFDDLRRNYPMRREFRFTHVRAPGASEELQHKISRLGFRTPTALPE